MRYGGVMPPVPTPDPPPEPEPIAASTFEDEYERLCAWRIAHLEAIGLPYPLALELAHAGADWHRVARAMERGMSVDQVERVFL